GTEPKAVAREEPPAFDDELERAVSRLRARREEPDVDPEREFAPRGDGWRDDELDVGREIDSDADTEMRPDRGRGVDRRPAPRAEDYLAPIHDHDRPLRPSEAEAGEYRARRRAPADDEDSDDDRDRPV